jgi:nucleoside-diphosphate-sugar epimerase
VDIVNIVGRGFIAKSFQPLADHHPKVTVLAAGVSSTGGTSEEQFARERGLLAATIDQCRRHQHKLVFFSTASAGMYGTDNGDGREDGQVRPHTPYGRHKLALERMLAASDIDHVVLRISHLVGPNQRAHQLLPALIVQVRSGRVRVHRGATRDLIDIADLVRLADGLLEIGLSREVVNIASGTQFPVEQIVDLIERAVATTTQREYTEPSGASSPVCVDKLRKLLPDIVDPMFPAEYPRKILDKYLDVLAHAQFDNHGGHGNGEYGE